MMRRREALGLAGTALLGLSAGPAAAAPLGDWLDGASMALKFTAAGIPVRSYNTPSAAMAPTLVVGDVFLADLRDASRTPRRGDVVVFRGPRDPSITYVKRVVGLPGERVQMTDGRLSIDGRLLKRREIWPYTMDPSGQRLVFHHYVETLPTADDGPPVEHGILEASDRQPYDDTPDFIIPAEHCFMMGDNRDNSLDSRVAEMGPVPIGNIIGRVVYRLRPNSGWLVPPETVPGLG
jgi:signal peptidase I